MKQKLRINKTLTVILVLLMTMSVMSLQVFAARTVYVLDEQVSITDSLGNGSVSGDIVTITAAGGSTTLKRRTNTVTIYNESDKKAELSFDYVASNYSSFSESSASGRKTAMLESGGYISMSITGAKKTFDGTAELKLSNFSLVVAAESSSVTVEFDSALGGVTAGGTAVSSGETKEGVTSAEGIVLVATAKNGATFLGWVDADTRERLSAATSYALTPVADMTVEAVFTTTKPYFLVGNLYLYDDLNEAATKTASATSKTIVLVNNATLPAGNYTIPAGVTLLIPRDAANTVYTNVPARSPDDYVAPTAYRTLTMAEGANLTVKGSLSLAGGQSAKFAYNGSVIGPAGYINMNDGSAISIENGGFLYAWGYITGAGTVEAKSGATVYENFQVMDYRGGDATSQMEGNNQGVFPMSQYYIQNIEVPLTLYAGAKEYAYMSVDVTLVGVVGTPVLVVGPGGMFQLSSGYIVKDYIEGTGRTEFETNGDFAITPVSITMQVTLLNKVTIDSEKLTLPIPGHITVRATGGTVTIDQDIALLPGSELYIGEGVVCTLSAGHKIIVYDLDNWDGYCGASNLKYAQLWFAPGELGTVGREKDALAEINGIIDASAGEAYTTVAGANIYSSGTGKVILAKGNESNTYQATQREENGQKYITYHQISVTPAQLKNAGGENYETSNLNATSTKPATLQYENGEWRCVHAFWTATTYTWSEDGKTCTAKRICENDAYEETTTATIASAVKTPASCTEKGTTTYTATFEASWAVVQTKDVEDITETGHKWGETTYTWSEDGKTCTAKRVCENVAKCEETATATIASAVKTPAGCTTVGTTTYTANFTESWAATQTKDVDDIPPTTHNWGAATYTFAADGSSCTAKRVCTKDSNHVEEEGGTITSAVKTPASCTEKGTTTYTATFEASWAVVQTKDVQDIPATNHAYGIWTKADGTNHQRICANDPSHVEIKEHAPVVDAAVVPTCIATGLTEGKHCSVCNEVLVAQTVVDAKGHTAGAVVVENSVAADCENAGSYDNVVYCTSCGTELSRQTVTVGAKGHDYAVTYFWTGLGDESAVALFIMRSSGVSCVAVGECENCDHEETVVAEITSEVTTQPTISTEGTTTHNAVFNNVMWAKPQAETSTTIVATVNGTQYTRLDQAISAAKNSESTVVLNTSVAGEVPVEVGTSIDKGDYAVEITAKEQCSKAVTDETTGVITMVDDHTASNAVKENNVPATCTVNGSYDNVVYCTICGTETSRETITVPATNHPNKHAGAAKAATCTEAGHTAGVYCPDCETWLTAQEEIPASGHTDGEIVVENEVANDCTNDGSYDNVVYCTICGTETSRETITVPATNHPNKHAGAAKAATCTEVGHTAGVYCPDCETWLTAQEEIPASGHSAGEIVVENEVEGSYDNVEYCTGCGEEVSRETITTTGGTTTGGTTTGGTTTGGSTTGGSTTGGSTTGGSTTGGSTTGGSTTGGSTTGGSTTGGSTTGGTTTGGSTTGGTTTGGATVVLGDANYDGKVDSTDAVLILRNLAGYEVPNFNEEAADFNGDGKADSTDAVLILRKLAGY